MSEQMSLAGRHFHKPLRRSLLLAVAALSVYTVLGLPSVTAAADTPTAVELMQQAHDGRAEWIRFPGFTAHLKCTSGTETVEADVTITADGRTTLNLPEGEQFQWVRRAIRSLVNHRIASSPAITTVEFAEEQATTAQGRLLRSTATGDQRKWRVKGDVMTEVHGASAKDRFMISVADVFRTPEGKHLPKDFVVTTWNVPENTIKSARQVHVEWLRVEKELDLPARYLAVTTRPDGSLTAQQIEFSQHKTGSAAGK